MFFATIFDLKQAQKHRLAYCIRSYSIALGQ